MSNDLMLDVGQANELKLAFRRAKWTNENVKRLCETTLLADIQSVLYGYGMVQPVEHRINCMANPLSERELEAKGHKSSVCFQTNFKAVEHRLRPSIKWLPDCISLYQSEPQRNGKSVKSLELLNDLAGKSVMNACILDHLLDYPLIIPDNWRDKTIYFWGTLYTTSRAETEYRYVRCLYYYDGKWYWQMHDVHNSSWMITVNGSSYEFAALHAS